MQQSGWRKYGKRFAAPAAFLLAATIVVVIVRSGLQTSAASDATSTRTVVTKPVTTKPVPPRRRRYYRLKSGQTLSDVAIKFNTTVEQLLALNPGVSPTNLTVNQRIRVK
jgi:LysM repeat protein